MSLCGQRDIAWSKMGFSCIFPAKETPMKAANVLATIGFAILLFFFVDEICLLFILAFRSSNLHVKK